jgi:fumarate reductase subunit C
MTRSRPRTRSFHRPMSGWWRRDPFFVRYMLREGTAIFLTVYALTLMVGLWRLGQGEAAFEAWRTAHTAPLALAWHALALGFVSYHAVTWFGVMPKTAPWVPFDGKWITRGGWTVAVLVSVAVLALLRSTLP